MRQLGLLRKVRDETVTSAGQKYLRVGIRTDNAAILVGAKVTSVKVGDRVALEVSRLEKCPRPNSH